MNIISYNEYEVDSRLTRYLSKLSEQQRWKLKYEANPELQKIFLELSKKYGKYKGFYEFPPEFKVMLQICFKL